jgi:hypothetical protein
VTRPDPDYVTQAIANILRNPKDPDALAVATELSYLQVDWQTLLEATAKQLHAIAIVQGVIDAVADLPQDVKADLQAAVDTVKVAPAPDIPAVPAETASPDIGVVSK